MRQKKVREVEDSEEREDCLKEEGIPLGVRLRDLGKGLSGREGNSKFKVEGSKRGGSGHWLVGVGRGPHPLGEVKY